MPVFSQIYAPMWKCTACISRAPYGLGQCSPLSPRAPLVMGSPVVQPVVLKGGIITPCPSAGSFLGLVRITWSPAKRSLSSSIVFWATLPTQGCRGAAVSALMRIATKNRRPASQARHFPVATSSPISGRSMLYSQQPN